MCKLGFHEVRECVEVSMCVPVCVCACQVSVCEWENVLRYVCMRVRSLSMCMGECV